MSWKKYDANANGHLCFIFRLCYDHDMNRHDQEHLRREAGVQVHHPLHRLRAMPMLAGAMAILAGLISLSAWAFDFSSFFPAWVSMKSATAFSFILSGAALILSCPPAGRKHRRPAVLLALLVGLIAGLALAEYLFSWPPALCRWLTSDQPDAVCMAPDAAFCFILLAAGVIIVDTRKSMDRFWAVASLGFLVAAGGLTALFSHLSQATSTFGFWGLTTMMAIPAAVLFVLLGLAIIICAWPDDLTFRSITGRYTLKFALWGGMVLISLCWGLFQQNDAMLEQATVAARANINKDISFRKWATSHGGVYVKPTASTPPNPYLKVPERDVVTTTGVALTLMNPAYMLREMQSNFGDEYGTKSQITSLKPINPNNAPDPWQVKALTAFEHGRKELTEITRLDNRPYMRMMLPLFVEEGCLKCHAQQGYKLGDIRGGVSTAINMTPFLDRSLAAGATITLSHAGIWLIGVTALFLFYRREYFLDEKNRETEEEKQLLEGKLRQAQKMEAIGTLAGGIAHDFNNILSVIFGYNELAMLENDPVKRKNHLKELQKGAIRARDLVAQILAFSRKAEQQKQPLQISLIVKETLKMLRASIPATIEIKQDIAANGLVLADPTQIHQVIMNLCTNAYQAMRETGGTLAVSLKEVAIGKDDYGYANLVPGRYLKLAVSDTGPGIPPELLEKIFEPYFTTKKAGEGTGLGLAVVHGIVKSHHGHITVYSEFGKGANFHVYLPLTEAAPFEQIPRQAEPGAVGHGESIMLVDDEVQIREVVTRMLTGSGYRVTAFADGPAALAEFRKNPDGFDLLITDMTMPQMTGADLAREIMAASPGTPVILCTGQSELINREQALAMGINDYLSKPVPRDVLLAAVGKALAGPG